MSLDTIFCTRTTGGNAPVAMAARWGRAILPLVDRSNTAGAATLRSSLIAVEHFAAGVENHNRILPPLDRLLWAVSELRNVSADVRSIHRLSVAEDAFASSLNAWASYCESELECLPAVQRQLVVESLLAETSIINSFIFHELSTFGGSSDRPIPLSLFPSHSSFELNATDDPLNIGTVSQLVQNRLFEFFRRNPSRLFELSPRAFEELIAEVWDAFGYEVELIQQTRDGGRDIVALSNWPSKQKYLIECKRYAKDHRVGIEIVDRLGGVVLREGANQGIIVTTSSFTAPARKALASTWYLDGVDMDALIGWLTHYQDLKFYNMMNITPPQHQWRNPGQS